MTAQWDTFGDFANDAGHGLIVLALIFAAFVWWAARRGPDR